MAEAIPCRLFLCKNPECSALMMLPVDRLLQLIVDPTDPSKDSSVIAVLCHRCSQIKTYSVLLDSSDRAGEDRLVRPDHSEGMNLLTWLKCEEESCTDRVPLIETWSNATTLELQGKIREANAQKIEWTHMTCPNGHPIPYPYIR